MLPEGWKRVPLGQIAQITSGGTPDRSEPSYWDGDIPWVTTGEIQFNTIIDTTEKITEAGLKNSSAKLFPAGTLLMAMYGQGKTRGQVAKLGIKATTNQNSAAILFHEDQHPDFYFHYLASRYEDIREFGNSGGVSHLNAGLLKLIEVPTGPRHEQARMAEIFSVWDAAITTTEKLLANSHKQKESLMRSLLTGVYRLHGRNEKLTRRHAAEVFAPISVRRNEDAELLSVTQDFGVLPRRMLERKVVMPEGSTESYKLVEPGDFIISLRSFQGGLEYSKYRGLVSPAYTVLRSVQPICHDFYRHYFKSKNFIGRLAVAVIGIRDGKQISYDDFAFLKLPAPHIDEQHAIAKILNDAEREIELLSSQVGLLKSEKQSLMTGLLTGKRRIHLPDVKAEPRAA